MIKANGRANLEDRLRMTLDHVADDGALISKAAQS